MICNTYCNVMFYPDNSERLIPIRLLRDLKKPAVRQASDVCLCYISIC